MNLGTIFQNTTQSLRAQGLIPTLKSLLDRAQTRWSEWQLGIGTDAIIELSALGLDDPDWKGYAATRYGAIRKIVRTIRIDPKQHVFLDYGAGMGRAMILAARLPFRRVLGVELSPQLAEKATRNFLRCKRKLRCQNLDIFVGDAAAYSVPNDVTIVYFFNPFSGATLRSVLQNLRQSLRAAPRDLWVICNLPDESKFELEVHLHPWLELQKTITMQGHPRCLIFRAKNYASIPSVLHAAREGS